MARKPLPKKPAPIMDADTPKLSIPSKIWHWTTFKMMGGIMMAIYMQAAVEHIEPIRGLGSLMGLTHVVVVLACVAFVSLSEMLPRDVRISTDGKSIATTLFGIGFLVYLNDYIAKEGGLADVYIHELRIAEGLFLYDSGMESVKTVIHVLKSLRGARPDQE